MTYTSGVSSDNINTVLGGGTVSVAGGGGLGLGGAISGTAGLALGGGGTLAMTGAASNSYTGATSVNSGTLVLDKFDPRSGSSSTAIPGDLTIGDGTDPGTVVLGAADQTTAAATLTITQTGTLTMSGRDDTVGTLVLDNASLDTGTGTLTLAGDLSNDSSTSQVSLAGDLALTAGTHHFDIADPYSGAPDAVVSASIGGPGGLIKTNTGSLELSGAESFAGTLEVAQGLVRAASGASFTGGGIAVDSGAELDLAGGGTVAVPVSAAGTGVGGGGGGAIVGAAGQNTPSGPLTLDGDATLAVYNGTLTASGAIGDGTPSAGSALTMTGGGTLVLSGANTYTGATTIVDGVVSISDASALADSSGIAIDSGGELDLDGVTLATPITSVAGTGAGGGGAIVNLGGTSALSGPIALSGDATVAVNAGGLTLSGGISGSAALTDGGSGTLSLTTAGTYTGGTTVAAGTLAVASSGATGTAGVVEVQDGATLQLATTSYSLPSGGLQLDASSTLADANGTADAITGGITLAGGATIDVGAGGSLTISGAIVGGYGLTSDGAGTLILTGNSSYTGATTVSAGTLEVDGSIADSGGVALSNGATLSGGGAVPVATADGTLQPGSSASTGLLTVAGGTLNSDATLALRIDGATAGAGYDQLAVSNSATLTLNDPALDLSLGNGYVPPTGTVFTLVAMSGGTLSGTFDWQGQPLADGSTFQVGNTIFQIAYNEPTGDLTATVVRHVETWTGSSGTDTNWSTPGNRLGGVAPAAGDDLIFPSDAVGTSSNDFTAGTDFHSITIGAAADTFTGNAIQLDDGLAATYASGTSTFGLPVQLTAAQNFVVNGGTLDATAAISGP